MATASAIAPVPNWLMEPRSSLGPQYQPFYIPSTFDNTTGEMHKVPHHIGFHTSSARDEPLPTPRSVVRTQLETPIPKSSNILEADRLSRELFEAIFASNSAEVAEAHAREARRKSYIQCEPAPLYPLHTGVSIEDSKRVFDERVSPESVNLVAARLRQRGARLIFDSDYPPVATFLEELEQKPDLLRMAAGKGRNVREWTSTNLPEWYIRVTQDSKAVFMDLVCYVAAALKVYNIPTHPAHCLFWNNLTCRAQSSIDDKQSVWERTAEKINELLALKEDFPVDRTNCAKFTADNWELQHLAGKDRHTRVKELFPSRWLPELGLGLEILSGNPSPRTKKREAAVPPATERAADPSGNPAAPPHKRIRIVTFAESPRKSSRVGKAKVPQTPTHEGGDEAVARVTKRVKAAKVTSAILPGKQRIALVTTKAKLELTAPQHPLPSHSPTRTQQRLSQRKARVTPLALTSTAPSKPSLTLRPQSLNLSIYTESGSPGSSTVVSPVGGDSRGSSASADTAVSTAVDSKDGNGKRKRADESDGDADLKVAQATEVEVEEVVAPRRTTRARGSKMTAKAATTRFDVQPVEGVGLSRKRQKVTKSSSKV